jgi:hypothetical protein
MRKMTSALNGVIPLTLSLALLLLGASQDGFAHGEQLEKKAAGPASVEVGPHDGAAINIGDGHFELVRGPAGDLSLYRLDDDLKAIPAEDVDAAEFYALLPGGQTVKAAMHVAQSDSVPLHFSVVPKITLRGGYSVVISVSMGNQSRNLRFQVN